MNDPNPNRPPQTPPPAQPPEAQRKSASPLIWILLLIALLAFGWYFYTKDAPVPQEPTTPPPPPAAVTDPAEEAAAQERAAAERREARRQEARKAQAAASRDARPVARTPPEYPAAALRAREEGSVLVRAEIDANGVPTNVELAKRSGSRDLDRAALAAVRKWKFEPAMKNGKAVASTVQVPVEFTLSEQ